MTTINEFKQVFGELEIITEDNMENQEQTFKVKSAGLSDKGFWYVGNFMDQVYTTFEGSLGPVIEDLKTGEQIKLTYVTNLKGFKNIKGIEREIDVNEDSPVLGENEGGTPSPTPKRTEGKGEGRVDRDLSIIRQVSWKCAAEIIKPCISGGIVETEEQIAGLAVKLAHAIEEDINR